MRKPSIRYLVSSPYGDIPVDKKKWHLPLERDALKTPYKTYFHSIRDFIVQDEFKPLLEVASKRLGSKTHLKEVNEIIVRSEKHGFLYHPASIEVILKDERVKFGLNVAISDTGKDWLREEFFVLQRLTTKFNLPYLPRPYFFAELNSMVFLLEEWFEGYHEFHISKDDEGNQRLKLWEFGNGYKYLTSDQSFEIYRQASKILALFYDLKDSSQIYPWHHASGDFVAKVDDKKIDVRLTTARRYEPLMVFTEKEPLNPLMALFYFFLNLSVRMRLDKLDGLGEVVWADDLCLEATVTGFLEALKLKGEFEHYPSQIEEFLRLLKSFGQEELTISFNPLIGLYKGQEDFPVIIENFEKHIGKLHITLQSHPL